MITSAANSRMKQLVQWRQKPKERKKAGVFVVEGIKMFEEVPEAWLREIYISESLEKKLQQPGDTYAGRDNNGKSIPDKLNRLGYETVSDELFRKISDTQTPQGILCVLTCPRYKLSDLMQGENPLLVVLEDLQDPGNLGTIVRTGEGAGITGVILTKESVDIFNPKTIRATMGSVYRVPFLYVDDIQETLSCLQAHGVAVYAAHLKSNTCYDSFSYTKGTAFLIGNEGNGLKEETAKQADHYLKIPMAGRVESLNAAIAASLLMYEAAGQRRREQ